MAIYHLNMGHVSRSTGRSSVQSVAYITKSCLFEERRGITADYRGKSGDVVWKTLAPEGSGIDEKNLDFWNKLETFEDEYVDKRYLTPETREKYLACARVAHTYVFALPRELDINQNEYLIDSIINEYFVSKGLVATYGIHWDEGNPHVHIQCTNRAVEGNLYEGGKFSDLKVARELFTKKSLVETREFFATKTNDLFKELNMEERIDHRSNEERNINCIPTLHKGFIAHELEKQGLESILAKHNLEIDELNKERIAYEPSIVINELLSTRATFSELDVVKIVQNRMKDDASFLVQHVIGSVIDQSVMVGTGITGQQRFTSQEYLDRETGILDALDRFKDQKAAISIDKSLVDKKINEIISQGKEDGFSPNEQQLAAIKTLCGDNRLTLMIGRAGTGKTTTLKPVIELHQEAGYDVWGMAPSAAAASQLQEDTGVRSDTLAHYAYYWKKYDQACAALKAAKTGAEKSSAEKEIKKCLPYLPNDKTLILVDEIGMVGVGNANGSIPGGWDAIVKAVGNSSAKIALTGDNHQFKPVEGGDVLRKLVSDLSGTSNLCELTEIKRQNLDRTKLDNQDWMRKASEHLSELNTGTALEIYERENRIHELSNDAEVYKAMATAYMARIKQKPDSKGMVLAATNKECHALNESIRNMMKQSGLLPKEDAFLIKGQGYSVGDTIVFTKNDRNYKTLYVPGNKDANPFVQNSMFATIKSIKAVKLIDQETGEVTDTYKVVAQPNNSNKAKIEFYRDDYHHFAHGYAVTAHKSQGKTVHWTLAKASPNMDAHGLYVTMTRHRDDVQLYYSNEDFKDFASLTRSLSKANFKDLTIDYSIPDERKEYWYNVQDFKESGKELIRLGKIANSFDDTNPDHKPLREEAWKFHSQEQDQRKFYANLILSDRESHSDFVRQANLTFESLEIAAGLKQRPLSNLERQAQVIVEQYAAAALEARQLWRDIRKTHPGIRARTHQDWAKFEEARDLRGILANTIHSSFTLHRPFLKETIEALVGENKGYDSKNNKISYSAATIKAQGEAHQSKMLQAELLKDNTKPEQQAMVKILAAYVEARDQAGQIWAEVKPKLQSVEGTLLKDSFVKSISEYSQMRIKRDGYASQIVARQDSYMDLADKVGIKLDVEKLADQAVQANRDMLFKTWQSTPDLTAKLEAAYGINALIQKESTSGKKLTISQVYQQGFQPGDITRDALEHQKLKLYETLKAGPERELFLLLDEYGDKCRVANELYSKCAAEVKDKPDARPWHSTHYNDYKAACEARNDNALEVFDQRDHGQVIAMAEKMGIRFKDVELEEVFSRCEQATRNRNINAYIKAETPDRKGEAAIAIRQMIEFEKRDASVASKTAQQAYHSGIDFKELQKTAFDYGRACILKGLTSEKEVQLYHALEAYENAYRPANKAFRDCIEESKTKTTKTLEVKPWETEKYKDYLSLVAVQDETAHQLIKGYDLAFINTITKQMGISPKKLDVEAHRHSLRQTLQTFIEGDRTNVPMAAKELVNWLEFDRHSDHKHTFKVVREQDLWPKDIQEALDTFFEKKRDLRHEERKELKGTGQAKVGKNLDLDKPQYRTITYERQQSHAEIENQLKEQVYELATFILGNPVKGNPGSRFCEFKSDNKVAVGMNGAKRGVYVNFVTGVKGGIFKLIEDQVGLSYNDAKAWATDWLGGNPLVIEQRVVQKKENEKVFSTWTPITPVPKNLENPDIANNKFLNWRLRQGWKEAGRYAYRDEQGNLQGYVFRFEKPNPDDPNGKKEKVTPPLAYCVNEHGKKYWQWKKFFESEKTPYGLEKLAQDPNKPVLVVEGEKKADVAQKMLPGYHVLGWMGGAGNVGNTNWSCLAGHKVVVWPDNDVGGLKAADTLQKIVTSLNTEKRLDGSVGIVSLPKDLPEKWDLADKLPEGWTVDTVKNMIKEALPLKDKAIVIPQDEIPNLTLNKEYTFEERQTLAYLNQEIKIGKYEWLDESDVKYLVNLTTEDLKKALEEWQFITDDHSFDPYEFNSALADNINCKDEALSTLNYLKQEIVLEKYDWLSQEECKRLHLEAEKDPLKTLREWQSITHNYSFVPGGIESLNADQLKAYEMLQELKYNIGDEKLNEWHRIFKDSPQEVIEKCQPILDQKKAQSEESTYQIKLDVACRRYIDMSDKYQSLSWGDPQRENLERALNEITGKYLQDEKFVKAINNTRNENAIRRMNSEIQQRDYNMSRGMSLDR